MKDLSPRAVAVGIAIVAAVVIAIYLLGRLGPTEIDEPHIKTVAVGDSPVAIAAGAGGIWVTSGGDRTLQKIDPVTQRTVAAPVNLGEFPGGVAVGGDSVWVGSIQGNSIVRVDPNTVTATGDPIAIGDTPQSVAVGEGSLWVAAFDEGRIARVDLATGRVVGDTFKTAAKFPSALTWGFGSLWIADVVDDVVVRLDTETMKETKIPVGDSPTFLATGDGRVWVVAFNDQDLMSINPRSNEVSDPVPIGGTPGGMTVGDGYVWITRADDDFMFRLNAHTLMPSGVPVKVGDNPQGVAVDEDGVAWVANQGEDTVTRISF
jgi:streptogramin lyase